MTKTKIAIFFLLIQAVFTFFIGIILASQGADEVSIMSSVVAQVEDVADTPEAKNVLDDTKSMLRTYGFWMSFLSVLEIIILLIALVMSFR